MMNDLKTVIDVIGKEMYFVHKGTWENNYEWRIEKIKVRGCSVDEKGRLFVQFGFNSCGYDYPFTYLKPTMSAAKKFAIQQITLEKRRQIEMIEQYK